MRVVKTTIMPILTIVCLLSHNVTKSSCKKNRVKNGSFLAIGCGAVALGARLILSGADGNYNSIESAICGTTRKAYETGFDDATGNKEKKKGGQLCPGLTNDFGVQGKNAGLKIGFGGGFVGAGAFIIGYCVYNLLFKKTK